MRSRTPVPANEKVVRHFPACTSLQCQFRRGKRIEQNNRFSTNRSVFLKKVSQGLLTKKKKMLYYITKPTASGPISQTRFDRMFVERKS